MLSQLAERLIGRFLFSFQTHPQEPPPFKIIDPGEIAMSFFNRDFFDLQKTQGLKLLQPQLFLHHASHNGGHDFPIQSKVFGHFFKGKFLCQQGTLLSQGMGRSDPLPELRHSLHLQIRPRTYDPKWNVDNPESFGWEREICSTPYRISSSAWLNLHTTLSTSEASISQLLHVSYPFLFGIHRLHRKMHFHSQVFFDLSFHSHRFLTYFLSTSKSTAGILSESPIYLHFLKNYNLHDHF